MKKDKYKGKDKKNFIPDYEIHGRPEKKKVGRKEHQIKDALKHINIHDIDSLDDDLDTEG